MELSAEKTRDEERDYLRVARTLRDKLDALITSGDTDLGTRMKILFDVSQEELDLVLANNKATHRYDEISSCARSCCEHEQVLNPALWSRLPTELLQRVFAMLPFSSICRLKSLSKEWQLSLQSSSSEFTLALKESSPRILAGVTSAGFSDCWLHVLDGENNRWHALNVEVASGPANVFRQDPLEWVHMTGATDAGLVCYIEKDPKSSLNYIFVINPMTGVVKPLPVCHLLACSELTMMRIVVDRNTFHYKVIVVKHGPPVEAEVYDSEVQQWTKPKPSLGRIFGLAHAWRRNHHSYWEAYQLGPCAYDCRDGNYFDFGQDVDKWSGKQVISYALMEDRLFALYWDEREDAAFISEYFVPENATSWVKEKTHGCFPRVFWQPQVRKQTCRIHACNGFLFVFQKGGWLLDADPPTKHENGWIYELATCEWRALPGVPGWTTVQLKSFREGNFEFYGWNFQPFICELHWSIQP